MLRKICSSQAISTQEELDALRPLIRPGLNLHQLQQIRAIFDAFDLNKTGLVEPRDIKSAIQEEGQEAQSNPLYQVICDLNREGAGGIDFEKFVLFLTSSVTGRQTKEELLQTFQLFDDQKTGRISMSGLRRVAATFHLEWEEEDLKEMIRQADVDGDGWIDFEEFYGILSFRQSLMD